VTSDGSPARRVAVIVVPGVGDDAVGETLDAVAGHLVSRIELQDGERRDLVISPAGNEVHYRSPWMRLQDPDRTLEVDVYEMRWADISRFPGGLLRLLYTLYALLLQISTLGLEALRPLRERGLRRARAARETLYAAAWALAVPVLAVTAAVILETGALLAAVGLDDHPTLAAVIVATIAVLTFGFAAWGATRLQRGGWQGVPIGVAGLAALLLVAHAAWWVHRAGLRVGLANALVDVVAYPFRIAWLGAAAAAAVAAVVLAVMVFRRGVPFLSIDAERGRAALTGLLTLVVAPLGIALVSATLFAAFGAIALQVADTSTWNEPEALHCLESPRSWTTTDCAGIVLGPDEAADLGVPPGSTAADTSPADWAFRLFARGLGPLAPALMVAGILAGLLLLVAVLPFVLAIGTSGLERKRNLRAASERQGELMTSALQAVGNAMTGLLALLAVAGAAVGVWLTWTVVGTPGSSAPAARLGAAIALVVSFLVVAVRFIGVSPRRPFGRSSGSLERLRIALDIPYDVATYLRVSQPGLVAPRERMLRRYRALVGEVAAGGVDRVPYDALVIVSHSQGTVLSVATLFGDEGREPPARPIGEEEPGIVLPAQVSLLTCGSPLRQLYGERLPGQYDWVRELPRRPGGLRPITGTWVNLYRSGDYVGRTLWAPDPVAAAVFDPGRTAYDLRWPGGPRVVERCLGPGSHTGYWSDAALGDWVMRLVVDDGSDDLRLGYHGPVDTSSGR
jgi:hypothetical protein